MLHKFCVATSLFSYIRVMKIEEVIQQRAFKNERQKATVNVLYTHNWLTTHIKDFLKPYGVTMQQFNVLRILRGSSPSSLCAKDITDRMIDKNSNTTRIMDKLIKKGYINKCRGEVDRREVNISITEAGLELLKQIDQEESIDKPNYLNLSDAEAGLLSALLDKLREEEQIEN